MRGKHQGAKVMFVIKTTIKGKDGSIDSVEREACTSVIAYDLYREQYEVSRERMLKDEIENYMVEIIPSQNWKGVLDYHMTVGKK